MLIIRAALLIFLLTAVAACGGGGSSPSTPTAPTATTPVATTPPVSTPAPAPTPQPPANFGVFTFSFDAGTSVADQELIGAATQIANDYFTAAFGRTITTATQVRGALSAAGCTQGGSAAFTGAGSVTFCLGNPGWMQPGPILRRKIVVHELYHVLQFERRWLGGAQTGPDWIIEGSAELVGYKGLDSKALLSYSTAQGCQIKEYTDFGVRQPPGLPNLSAVESHQAWQTTQGPLYALAMTGMDQLLTARGVSALNTYMDAIGAGTPYQTAFQSAFGQSITAFYDQFPAYRAALTVPPAYLCGV